ncbi:hypothetical protein IACHDJAJ_00062 [Aeromonas phage vB_AdhS_TS3]|nr:hypothetical protein IACHDJAJ_00062 [Aeromonas phage vB_AdhS_TS3]
MNKQEILNEFRKKQYFAFSFQKADGSIRYALGTNDNQYISKYWNPSKEGGYEEPEDVVRYFDVDANAWRSFRVDRFISMEPC